MKIYFATCERVKALEYLKKFYPSYNITEGSAKDILDLVQQDIIRIPDPNMHGLRAGIVPGNNWNESYRQQVKELFQQLLEKK